jgi:hypothetical protein
MSLYSQSIALMFFTINSSNVAFGFFFWRVVGSSQIKESYLVIFR